MIEKGSLVKINFANCDSSLPKSTKQNLYKFDNKYNSVHKVTNIYIKNLYAGKQEIKRIELDGEYVFYEKELILLDKGDN